MSKKRRATAADEDKEEDEEELWDTIKCDKCNDPNDEELLVECSANCDRWFHTYCVGLSHVPEGVWACPYCAEAKMEGNVAMIGDIVFAKVEEFPWWPGVIIGFGRESIKSTKISAQVPRRGTLTKKRVEINFIYRGVYDKVDALRVVPFISGLQTLHHWSNASVGTSEEIARMCTRKEFKRALSTALKLAAERRAAISVISVLDAKLLILNRASLDHQLPSWVTKHQDHYDIVASMTRPVLNEEKNSLLPHPVIVDTEKQDGTKYKVNSIQAAQASPTCKENMRPRVKEFLQGEFQGERDENTQAWIQAMLETGIDDNTICLVLRNRFSSQTIDIKPEPKSPPTINKVEIESTSQPINAYPPDANNRKRQKSCILERIPSETASSVL